MIYLNEKQRGSFISFYQLSVFILQRRIKRTNYCTECTKFIGAIEVSSNKITLFDYFKLSGLVEMME